jgi:hypothetical protein
MAELAAEMANAHGEGGNRGKVRAGLLTFGK